MEWAKEDGKNGSVITDNGIGTTWKGLVSVLKEDCVGNSRLIMGTICGRGLGVELLEKKRTAFSPEASNIRYCGSN